MNHTYRFIVEKTMDTIISRVFEKKNTIKDGRKEK